MNSWLRIYGELWPRRRDLHSINPDLLFDRYNRAIDQIQSKKPSSDDERLLELSWKLFENDAARRMSIDTRAGMLMPAVTLAATLVIGVGLSVIKDAHQIPHIELVLILITYAITLIYFTRTAFLVFTIHGRFFRHTPDPGDIIPPFQGDGFSPFARDVSIRLLRYTVHNYKANNMQMENSQYRATHFSKCLGGYDIWSVAYRLGSLDDSIGLIRAGGNLR